MKLRKPEEADVYVPLDGGEIDSSVEIAIVRSAVAEQNCIRKDM